MDGSITVTVNTTTGAMTSVTARSVVLPLGGRTSLSGVAATSSVTVSAGPNSVNVTQCVNLTCVTESYTAASQAVRYTVTVATQGSAEAPWTAPISHLVSASDASRLKIWAPWDRDRQERRRRRRKGRKEERKI